MNKNDFFRKLRRIQQQTGPNRYGDEQQNQIDLIKKLYERNGFKLVWTCSACPEQYDVFQGEKQVGYLRLRHGCFTVDYPTCMEETIFQDYPKGDGMFETDERFNFLTKALRAIQNRLK
jgi:hypothetical protein